VTQDQQLLKELYPALKANYAAWEKTHLDPNGLFWQIDDRDGMEMSIGGSGYRPTINSYMFGDAMALSEIAMWDWKADESVEYRLKAEKLRELVETKLWNETARFYETLPRGQNDPDKTVNVRELIGYVPLYFNLPNPGREAAWRELLDSNGFAAPFGPTTAERRNPNFMFQNPHECLWNGPSWPYATSQTLTAMANLLNNYKQTYISKADYLELLRTYTRSQHLNIGCGDRGGRRKASRFSKASTAFIGASRRLCCLLIRPRIGKTTSTGPRFCAARIDITCGTPARQMDARGSAMPRARTVSPGNG
jgi:glycogen debranching enzyme